MGSSNRHWPSMFKSKPCNSSHHHCWDINSSSLLSSPPCHRPSPYSSFSGTCEERSPEPKPRWNPKPEQIRILESIFNSGMVNPPRDEIRKIRAQLQEYGQVGDANVFYWFQNRKSRSKHKNRHLQTTSKTTAQSPPVSAAITTGPTSSSSSSSEKSSSDQTNKSATAATFTLLNSPTASVNQQQPYFSELLQEPYYFSHPSTGGGGFCFPELGSTVMDQHGSDQTDGTCSGGLLTDLMMMTKNNNNKGGGGGDDQKMMKPQSYDDNNNNNNISGGSSSSSSLSVTAAPPICHSFVAPTAELLSNISHIQGVDAPSGFALAKSTVFINDVAFEVPVGPFNVREAFGEDAVLIHSSGHPVDTNDWGVTLHSLQHGAFYYLLRTLSQVNSLDLI